MTKKTISLFLAALLLFSLVLSAPAASAEGLPFVDVKEGKYYYEAVEWAYENGYVSGTSETTFSPNKECTRAEFVMILWAIAGKPEPTIDNPFADVREGKWYYKAVLWAKETGLTDGKTPDTFAPNDTCTRAEAVFFIWKYFGAPVLEPEVEFDDVKAGRWYYDAVNWAFSSGITSGTDYHLFSPHANVTRAMLVTFLFHQKHVLDGGEHAFALIEDVPASCAHPAYRIYACECGNRKTVYYGDPLEHVYSLIEELPATCTQGESKTYACTGCGILKTEYSGEPLGHDFCQAKLIADATATSPTIYQLVCIRCGEHDGNGNRRLGKSIYGPPVFHSNYKSHVWTEDELINGIQFTSSDGATATIRRKWFANAWCYIAEIVLPEGAYSHFTGTNIVNLFGTSDESVRIPAYDLMNSGLVPDAQIMFNGDTQLFSFKQTLRAGQVYLGRTPNEIAGWDASYWNPSDGSYGSLRSLRPTIKDTKFSTLTALGITDTYSFRAATLVDGRMNMDEFNSSPDYDPNSYSYQQDDPVNGSKARRQCTMMGFKREGTTVHIFFVVADGNAVIDHNSANPSEWANDFASYGNYKREMMILLSTLGAEYAANMDGGHSAAMVIRLNGVVEQVSATDRDKVTINGVEYSEIDARELWDFVYFK